MELTQLIERVKQQDQQAFEELYNRYYSAGFSLALQFVKNEEDALDIMQDAFITVYGKLDTLESADKFKSWYMQIVANKCRDFLKKQKPLSFTDANAYDEEGELQFEIEETSRDFIPEAAVDYSETVRIVDEMISELPEEQRLCILLYFANDMSIPEIAKALQVSEATVKSRLKYGKDKIRAKTEDYEKKTGTKLYSLSGLMLIPFIRWALSQKPAAMPKNSGAVFARIVEGASKGGAQAVKAAAKSGSIISSLTTTQKVVGGVIAGTIFVGTSVGVGVTLLDDTGNTEPTDPNGFYEEVQPNITAVQWADHIQVEYTGNSGHGTATAQVDFTVLDALFGQEKIGKFLTDLGAEAAPSVASLLEFTLSGQEELSNGDKITITVTPSQLLHKAGKDLADVEKYFCVSFATTMELTVEGLAEIQEIDIFSMVRDHIVFQGANGSAYAYFRFPAGYQQQVSDRVTLAFRDAEVSVLVDGESVGVIDLSLIAPNPQVEIQGDLEFIFFENGPLTNGEILRVEVGDYNLEEILEALNPLGYTIETLSYDLEVSGL